jgi:hypothetical protein
MENRETTQNLIAWEDDLKNQMECCIELGISLQKISLSQINEKKTIS